MSELKVKCVESLIKVNSVKCMEVTVLSQIVAREYISFEQLSARPSGLGEKLLQ